MLQSRSLLVVALLAAAIVPTSSRAAGDGNDLLPDMPTGFVSVRLETVANVSPSLVIDITNAGDGSDRLFLVSPDGVIRILVDGAVRRTPFLDAPASPPDRAMSGLAFHPDFAQNGLLYVITGEATPNGATPDYTPPQADSSSAFDNVLFEYQIDTADPDAIDPASRRELLRIHQSERKHNMNDLTFGGDGFLYLAMGDGGDTRTGSPSHYNTNAQLTDNPYGTILRIDIDTLGANGRYGIPADNPLAGGAVPEILAWGVRNPWRISADRLTGEVYTAVNGEMTIEQVYRIESGRNYGWDMREGSFLWNPVTGEATADPSPDPQYTVPLAEYDHNGSEAFGSVIGGFVYRGSRMPALYGRYLSFDWVAGEMIAMDPATGALERVPIEPGGAQLVAHQDITWGEDEAGELYVGRSTGEVLTLYQAESSAAAGRVPDDYQSPGEPLVVTKANSGQITLDWGDSCHQGDTDYAIYEGVIGDFGSHQPLLCSTAGLTVVTTTPSLDDAYYLVVPNSGTYEGAYGTDGRGVPREASTLACFESFVANCD